MVPPGDIALSITQLADPDPAKRAAAARALRATAFALCFSECNHWLRDPDFLALAIPSSGLVSNPLPKEPSFAAGIAVQPASFERIRAANGLPKLADVPPDQDAKEFELHFEEGGLDVLTTREPGGSGAIARYLEKFGEGLQQVELNVTDVDRATELLRTRFGLAPIYPATRPGADGTRVNFFLAPAADGKKCLIELVEPSIA